MSKLVILLMNTFAHLAGFNLRKGLGQRLLILGGKKIASRSLDTARCSPD
jgi:hypothetical protein